MKKTLFALLAIGGMALGEGTAVNLTQTTLTSGEYNLQWNGSGTTEGPFTSWELTFTLNVANLSQTDVGIFSLALDPDANIGFNLYVGIHGGLQLRHDEAMLINLGGGTIKNSTPITVSLKYVNEITETYNYDDTLESRKRSGGLFTLTAGDTSMTYDVETKMNLNTIIQDTNKAGQFFAHQIKDTKTDNVSFTNIALSKLSDDIVTVTLPAPEESVPEPTTATLSLLALAGLAARRRRR